MKKQLLLTSLILLVTVVSQGQWQPDVRLTNNSANSWTSYNNAWCIALSGNVAHVAWYDDRDGNLEIYYKRSMDGGISWGADTRLTNNSAVSELPSVSVTGQVVHIAWEDHRDGNREIYYKRSTDGGVSWGADTRLTSNSSISENPSLTVSGLVIHVFWRDDRDGNWEIYYKRSTDGGTSWGADARLTNNSSESGFPSISVSGSTVLVTWDDDRDGNWEIYYKRSTDGGASWGMDARLTNNSFESGWPSVSVSGSIAHVIWRENRDGNYEIYYRRSTDGGVTWATDTRLTNNAAPSENPSISVSGQFVHIVWNDNRDGNNEIYYKRSTDGGVTWGADTRLTNYPGASWASSVSVSGLAVHVVWQEYRDGNDEIYYKRACQITAVPPANQTVASGGTGSFSAISTDTCLSFQWQQSTGGAFNNLSNTGIYSGVTTPTLMVSPVASSMNNYRYRCVITSCLYCTDTTADAKLTVGSTGIAENSLHDGIELFPNPFTDQLVVRSSKSEPMGLRIYDVTSRQLVRLNFSKSVTISTGQFSKGLYFYEIRNNSGVLRQGKLFKD